MKRILIVSEPFINVAKFESGWAWSRWGNWPAWWVDHPERSLSAPSVAVFRLKFKLEAAANLRLHVSADNRYRIFLDGHAFGRGSERGDVQHWFFETYEGNIPAGEHMLAVQTWWLGDKAPYAQISVRPGFMLAAEGLLLEKLSTGYAKWETALMPGLEAIQPGIAWGTGWNLRVDGATYPWGWESGGGEFEWRDAQKITEAVSSAWKNETPPYWMLLPAALPPMLDEPANPGVLRHLAEGNTPYPVSTKKHLSDEALLWNKWLSGHVSVSIPAKTSRTALIDLENYYCAYPELLVSGGRGVHILGKDELFFERLELWFQLSDHGFKTTFESPEPSRSDCHAWGAHPLFHCYATILGIRPDAPGFKRVRIAPMAGQLKRVSGTLPHPHGEIEVKLERGDDGSLKA